MAFAFGTPRQPAGGGLFGAPAPPTPVFGLVDASGRRTPLQLQTSTVDCRLLNTVAEVTITQKFTNRSAYAAEAVYFLPVDASMTVSSVKARFGDRTIVGAVLKSTDEYNINRSFDARIVSHAASLVTKNPHDRTKFDVLTALLGNMGPHSDAEVSVTFAVFFEVEGRIGGGGAILFSLPCVCVQAAMCCQPNAEDRSLAAEIFMSSPIKSISSPSHPFSRVELDPENQLHCRVEIRASARLHVLDDLVLKVEHADAHQPYGCLTLPQADVGREQAACAMVSFVPWFDEEILGAEASQPCCGELIFLVDRSSSMNMLLPTHQTMNGWRCNKTRIKASAAALQVFLRSLPEGCKFNVVSFGTRFSKLFPSSIEYNEESFATADSHVRSMQADMGATHLLEPLTDLLSSDCTDANGLRQIFILTDGDIPHTDSVSQLLRKHIKSTRVFAVGIGNNINKDHLKRIALAGNGQACFISSYHEVTEGVLGFLSEALKPVLQEVSIDWGTLQVKHQTPSPESLPPLFSGSIFNVFALLESGSMLEVGAQVTLKGKLNDVPMEFPLTVQHLPLASKVSPVVRTLAVQQVIRDLEESSNEECAKTAAQLSTTYQVPSSKTTFLAVEERKELVEGVTSTVQNPIGAVKVIEGDISHSVPLNQGLFRSNPFGGGGLFGHGGSGFGGGGGFGASGSASGNTGGSFGSGSSGGGGGGGSLFGSSQTASGGGLFGGGSSFGSSQTASGGSFGGGSLFGSSQTASGGLFGGGSGSLFGASSQTASGGSLGGGSSFGSSQTASGGLFGGGSGSLFGASSQTTSGGLFGGGSGSSSGSSQTAYGGGLFGGVVGQGGSSFGSSQTTSPGASVGGDVGRGGSFGSSQTASPSAGSFGGGDSFGSTVTSSGGFSDASRGSVSGGSTFGGPAVFGSSISFRPPASGGPTLFGTQTAPQPGKFGQAPAAVGLFGAPSSPPSAVAPAATSSGNGSNRPQGDSGLFGQALPANTDGPQQQVGFGFGVSTSSSAQTPGASFGFGAASRSEECGTSSGGTADLGGGGAVGNGRTSAPPGMQFGANKSPGDQMHSIANLQRSNGSWSLDEQFLQVSCFGTSQRHAARKLPAAIQQHQERESIWATAIAIAFLHRFCASCKQSFKLLEQKARRWLREQLQDNEQPLVDAAAEIF